MNAGQVAALIAAVAFAVGVCAAIYALLKLARLATEATRYLTGMQQRTDELIEQAHTAIDRANDQLTRTEVITSNVNEVTANVAELTEHMSALASLGRAVTAGPVGKAAALAYGVRRAVSLRRDGGNRRVAPAPRAALPPAVGRLSGERSTVRQGIGAGSITPRVSGRTTGRPSR
ncbi:MAG TPA: DUF948 domain-containing protein [Streptosporangiaceae bacterium]|jgi:uncharacterized protein YoxC